MKKSKLLLSLAMMCLSIAVLCFGVLAATNVSYTISGTISYEITDVFAKINTKVFKVAGVQDVSTMQTNVDTLATTALSAIASTTYIDSGIQIAEYDSTDTADNGKRENVSITLDSTYMTYYIVINIENLATKAICAKLTDSTTYSNLNTAQKLIQNNIAKDTTKNLVIAFSIADKTVSTSVTIGYSVEVGLNEYKNTISFKLVDWNNVTYDLTCEEGTTWEQFIGTGYTLTEGEVLSYGEIYTEFLICSNYSGYYDAFYMTKDGSKINKDAEIIQGCSYVMQGTKTGSK